MQDAVLVARILGGELSLFGLVVRRYDRKVRRLLQWSVRDPDSQEELVQQTFYLAFRSLEQLDASHKLESWLLRIARNCAADHHRARRARPEEPLPAEIEAAAPPPPGDVWEETRRLAPEQRLILELRYRDGLSYGELARRLHVPLSTVRGRLYEARKALRQLLDKNSDNRP